MILPAQRIILKATLLVVLASGALSPVFRDDVFSKWVGGGCVLVLAAIAGLAILRPLVM